MERQCIECGKLFEVPVVSQNRLSTKTTCSKACATTRTTRSIAVPVETVECPVCHNPFERKAFKSHRKKTCSERCAITAKNGYPPYTPEEREYIAALLGVHPPRMLLHLWNIYNARHGLPKRTMRSLRRLVYKDLKGSFKTVYDNLTTGDLARSLGVSYCRVQEWIRCNGLPCRYSGRKKIIKILDFGNWIKTHPRYVANIDPKTLEWVLEDHPECNLILTLVRQAKPYQVGAMPVICAQTGERFNTLREAAQSAYVSHQTLARYIRAGERLDGRNYLFAEKQS